MSGGEARWVRLGRRASLLLAISGRKYRALLARLALERGVVLSDTSAEALEAIGELSAEALATEVLRDWVGVSLGGSSNVPYTIAAGKRAIMGSDKFRAVVVSELGRQQAHERSLISQASQDLAWQMKWAGGIDALMLSYRKTGDVPKALQERPESPQDVKFYLECFYSLSKFRGGNGFGLNPLALSDVVDYAIAIGYERGSNQFFFFIEIMAELDETFRDSVRERADSNRPVKRADPGTLWVPPQRTPKRA